MAAAMVLPEDNMASGKAALNPGALINFAFELCSEDSAEPAQIREGAKE